MSNIKTRGTLILKSSFNGQYNRDKLKQDDPGDVSDHGNEKFNNLKIDHLPRINESD
jgi:hypothetical protein